jgi:regulator of protease activity HflC (stomatin/prohibitin superfamily)
MAAPQLRRTVELERRALNGWVALLLLVVWLIAALALFISTAEGSAEGALADEATAVGIIGGFHWANPLYARSRVLEGATQSKLKTKLSLRVHNFNSPTLKVNDKRGNPVEIAAVVVWRVEDTAQAVFDVEDYESYVQVQSESAIRSIASLYAYDHGEEHEATLRSGGDEVARELQKELEVRLKKAGVVVEEARLTHLAYAPEIAPAMLRRQQAEAVIAAREKIVLGAVSMVEMALNELAKKNVVTLDEERKAAMVSNLLVVLCGTEEASPVINTGTLYG